MSEALPFDRVRDGTRKAYNNRDINGRVQFPYSRTWYDDPIDVKRVRSRRVDLRREQTRAVTHP